jgi:protein-tyrosine-phosphatase
MPLPRRILFLCTGNCVRSQMAEALLRFRSAGRFEVFSAGSRPAGFVHSMTLEALTELHLPTHELRSKSINEFAGQSFDAVITLCGSAHAEICAVWPISKDALLPVRAHWGFEDPSHAEVMGVESHLEEFRRTRDQIRECVERLALAPDAIIQNDAAFAALIHNIGESLQK